MHALRHTYATRAIESGMQPKVLQKLLGHASITTTMNRYVHVTDDSMKKAVAQFAKAQEAQKGEKRVSESDLPTQRQIQFSQKQLISVQYSCLSSTS